MAETEEQVDRVTLERESVLRLMEWAGWKSVSKWPNKRLSSKIKNIKDVLAEDQEPEDEDLAETFAAVMEGIENGADFVVVGDEDEEKPVKKPKVMEVDEDEELTDGDVDEPVKKPTKKPAKKREGLRPSRSRAYCAAVVIKKHGLEAGITEEMVAEIDEMYGKTNLKETEAWAKIAWHALNGYLQKYPVESE